MKTYCASCKKYKADKYSSARRTKQYRLVFASNIFCGNKKLGLIRNQGASRLLTKFGIRAALSSFPLI